MTPEAARLTYAVADLHGRLDLLDAALAAVRAHAGATPQTIVFLGDYVDRGPHSAEVIARLAAEPPDGWSWICLAGNHETMMAQALREPADLGWWIDNGGGATIESYRGCRELVASHLAWIDRLPLLHLDPHRVFVHAGVDPDVPLDRQTEETLLWKRYAAGDPRGHGDRHVVHGHTPDARGPCCLAGRTALDTLAWDTGRLVVGVFDDDVPGGPIDLVEVLGDRQQAAGCRTRERGPFSVSSEGEPPSRAGRPPWKTPS